MTIRGVLAWLLIFTLFSGFARSGIYNTADDPKETRLSQDFRVFVGVLGDLRSLTAQKTPERESILRKRYLFMEALGKSNPELPTLEDKLNYSAVLMRRGRADEAIELLVPLSRQEPDNLIVQSHFATAHFLSTNEGFKASAAGLMFECLRVWPDSWDKLPASQKRYLSRMGWEGAYDQNRKYEVYLHKLMKIRKNAAPGEIAIDPLFTDKDGKPVRYDLFEVGKLPATEKKKLPGDAIEIVEQLLVWLPNDLRLYWQLGEIFNASAIDKKAETARYDSIEAGHLVLREIYNGLTDPINGVREKDIPKELRDHHEKLAKYIKDTPRPNPELEENLKPFTKPDDGDDKPATVDQSWRPWIVAFLTGLAVGLFTLWQFQEMRRRRQARA